MPHICATRLWADIMMAKEDCTMRKQKFKVYLTPAENSIVIQSLNHLRNTLLRENRDTGCVDDLLLKVMCASVKRIWKLHIAPTVGLQYILDKWRKRMKDKASSVKVGVADNNLTRGGHILHEQEYNTGHGVSAIPDEVRGEIRRQPGKPEV